MNQLPINICPLLAIASIGTSGGTAECVEDRCAWWSCTADECALVSLADGVADIAAELEDRDNGN